MGTLPTIYAHRGLWEDAVQQNTPGAIQRAGDLGFGVETDFRNHLGELIISHEPICSENSTLVSEINFKDIPTAMNVKEDGLCQKYQKFLEANGSSRSFIFDGSIPEMLQIHNYGLPHALRMSEYEREIPWNSPFVWLDGFQSEWWANFSQMLRLAEKHFLVFVSPELHARAHRKSWDFFAELNQSLSGNFGICTDYPIELSKALND